MISVLDSFFYVETRENLLLIISKLRPTNNWDIMGWLWGSVRIVVRLTLRACVLKFNFRYRTNKKKKKLRYYVFVINCKWWKAKERTWIHRTWPRFRKVKGVTTHVGVASALVERGPSQANNGRWECIHLVPSWPSYIMQSL